jgi:hypothetical protein
MINSVPTILEVVMGTDKRHPKEKTPKNGSKSNKSASKVWNPFPLCCDLQLFYNMITKQLIT